MKSCFWAQTYRSKHKIGYKTGSQIYLNAKNFTQKFLFIPGAALSAI